MRYVVARIEHENRDMAYRIYMTDCLKGVFGAKVRYADLVYKENNLATKEDAETIKDRLKKKLEALYESS